MNPFTIAFNAVVPIFLMIILGYGARRFGIIGGDFVNQASRWVFRISLPTMIFSKVASIDISNNFDASQISLMILTAVSIIAGFYISVIAAKLFIKEPFTERGYAAGAFIQGSFRSNYIIVSYPVLLNLYGDEITLSFALLTLVMIPAANILSIIALTPPGSSKKSDQFKALGLNVMKNPLIIAITLGFLSMISGLEFAVDYPGILVQAINLTASMATPLGLVVIGAFFHFEGFVESLKPTAIATSIKLVVIPFIIAAAAYTIGIDSKSIIIVCIALGGPAAISSFAMCNEMGGDSRLAGNIIILSSALCVLSYIAMITILLSL